jgi:hypothetical protein
VIDGGVLLNLMATGQAANILAALKRKLVFEELSARHLPSDRPEGWPGRKALAALVDRGLIARRSLSKESFGDLLSFTGAPAPNDLDDTEAACVVLAKSLGATMVADGEKTGRIAAQSLGSPPLHTLDLLSATELVDAIGERGIAEAVATSISTARFRVPRRFDAWMMTLGISKGLDAVEQSAVPTRVLAS